MDYTEYLVSNKNILRGDAMHRYMILIEYEIS